MSMPPCKLDKYIKYSAFISRKSSIMINQFTKTPIFGGVDHLSRFAVRDIKTPK